MNRHPLAYAALALVLILGTNSCTGRLFGIVVDADSERPIANATVGIWNSRWGFRDGQLVWDKSYRTQGISDQSGKFQLAVDGGTNLTVSARGYSTTITSACSSPMVVRIGGAYSDRQSGGNASIGVNSAGNRVGWSFDGRGRSVPESEADLVLVGPPPDWSAREVILQAPLGLQLVGGTGNPSAAPSVGYMKRLKVDFDACGWLFVRARSGIIAVDPRAAIEEGPDGSRSLLLIYRTSVR